MLEPRARFGRHGSHGLSLDDAVWSGTRWPLRWRWQGGGQGRPRPVAHGRSELLRLELTVSAGGRHDLVLDHTNAMAYASAARNLLSAARPSRLSPCRRGQA